MKSYYEKTIQIKGYLPSDIAQREDFQPFKTGEWAESYEEAREIVMNNIKKEIKTVIESYRKIDEEKNNQPPFKTGEDDPFKGQRKEIEKIKEEHDNKYKK